MRNVNETTIVQLGCPRRLLLFAKLVPVIDDFPLVTVLMVMADVNAVRTIVVLIVISAMKGFMVFRIVNLATVIRRVQVGKFVDPQGISVLVTLVTQDQSVINVPQDIMDSQTAGDVTVTSLALLHLMSVMSTMEIAHVVKCTPPDNVISAVRDFTPFLNVKFATVIARV